MSVMYTILPLDMVFAGYEEDEGMELYELPIKGGSLMVASVAHNQAKIVRVISSDPQVFLNPNLQPGSIIEFPYQIKM